MNAWLAKPIPFSLVYCDAARLFATPSLTGPNPWRVLLPWFAGLDLPGFWAAAIATMGLCDISFRTGFSHRTIDQF